MSNQRPSIKKITVATDLSARSDRALQRGFSLAAQHGSAVQVVHIVDDSLPATMRDQQLALGAAALEQQMAALHTAGVEVKKLVACGQPFADVIRRADAFRSDLIVLGAHRHPTRALFRGTTAERILRLGHFPVLVVCSPVANPYTRVLVAMDLSTHSRRALQFATALAPQGEFRLVHAAHVPFKGLLDTRAVHDAERSGQRELTRFIERDMQEFTRDTDVSQWEIVVHEGMPQSVIAAEVEHYKPDLIVLGTHGRSGIANLVLGSVAEDIIAEARTDVLTVKAW